MNFKKILLFLLFSLITMGNSKAQFWKKLEKKATQKVEQKIDKEADKVLDKALNTDGKKNKSDKTTNYTFTGKATIKVINNGDEASFNVFFSNNNDVFCMHMNAGEGQDIYNVITPKKATMFMNASGMKIRKSVTEDQLSNMDYIDKIPSKDDLKKTGNTKTILGYFCEEYKYQNDGGSISAWVTKNFPIKTKYAPMLGLTSNSPIKGFILELNHETINGEKANIKVVKIDANKKLTIKASEYKSMF